MGELEARLRKGGEIAGAGQSGQEARITMATTLEANAALAAAVSGKREDMTAFRKLVSFSYDLSSVHGCYSV